MDIQRSSGPDRSEAIKTLIERWLEKNKAKTSVDVTYSRSADKAIEVSKNDPPNSKGANQTD